MLPLELHDSVEIHMLPKSVNDDYVTCDDFSLSVSKYNLCHKMIEAAREHFDFKERFIVNIHKNIFIQAGLGGGSADAGAVLRGIVKLLKLHPSREELIDLAVSVGSDVPWALFNKPLLVERKGQKLEEINITKYPFVLLVKPKQGLSTQLVFEKADEMGYDEHADMQEIIKAYNSGDFEILGEKVFNALEKPAINMLSDVQSIKDMMRADGIKCVLMTGAGSCVFGLSNDLRLMKKLEESYTKIGFQTKLTKILKH
jgi:4-diphosphocytidyl-2-C-methyl-D-erythritol kinase